jgi:DNA-binding FrmR family transcriptional regulator
MHDNKKQIIDHLSRLEGQLASVKNEISKDKVDCIKASTTLLSASRSFAGLRQKFTESFLMKHFVPNIDKKDQELFEKLTALIKG